MEGWERDYLFMPPQPPLEFPDRLIGEEEFKALNMWNLTPPDDFHSDYDPDHPFYDEDYAHYLGFEEGERRFGPL
jgi:hypothetical protein